MPDTVRFQQMKRLGERDAGVEPELFAGVPHPVDIESVSSHAIEPGERRIELFAPIMVHTRPVALHEAVSTCRPSAVEVDLRS